jgi:hypothetical protein
MEKEITFHNPRHVVFNTIDSSWVRIWSADDNDQHYSLDDYDIVVTLKPKKIPEPREVWVRNSKRASSDGGYKEPEGLEPGDEVYINAIGYSNAHVEGIFYSAVYNYEVEHVFKVIPYFLYWFDFKGLYDD